MMQHGGHPEPDRISMRGVLIVAAVLVGCVVVVAIGTRRMAVYFEGPGPSVQTQAMSPDAAERRAHWEEPQVDLARVRAAEEAHLHAYRWIDRDAGIVQVPIERAMELIAAEAVARRK